MRPLLLTLAFIVQVSFCYYFTCDQLEHELTALKPQIPTRYACVVFEYPYSEVNINYYDSIRLRDTGTGNEYSLREVYNTCNYCVIGQGPWEVVRRGLDPISCHNEIVLLFTSQPTIVMPSRTDDRSCTVPYYNLRTIVSPNSAAIQTTISPLNLEVDVFLGVGIDESEQMYLIRGSDTDFTMTMFDPVISVSNNFYSLHFDTPNQDKIMISFDNSYSFLGSSAILGNSQPIIRVAGNIHYNSSNVLAIVQNYKQHVLPAGLVDITMTGDFQVTYFDHPDLYVFNRVNESFELDFDLVGYTASTGQPIEVPTEPTRTPTRITTQPPPKPTTVTTKFSNPATTVLTTELPIVNADSYCTCDVDENGIVKSWASELWLDIVILVDTGKSMGTSGVDEISSLIETLTGKMNLDSTGSSQLYSRVGLISLSKTANVIFNLNMTSDSDVDLKGSDEFTVDIEAGLQLAMKMFQDGKKMFNYRESARQIIYFITNSAPPSILNGAYEFKSSGGIIIVANYVREGQVSLDGLKSLASPNYFFTDLTDDYNFNLQVFCDANCYCPPELHPFTDGSVNPRQDANHGCYNVASLGIPYKNAVKTCQKEDAVMTTIHDDDKQFFINSIISNIGSKTKYWIGYQNDEKSWNWIDKSTDPYSNWDVSAGQPNTNGGQNQCAYAVQTTGFKTEWYAVNCDGGFPFVCEKAPCAAGRYCTFDD